MTIFLSCPIVRPGYHMIRMVRVNRRRYRGYWWRICILVSGCGPLQLARRDGKWHTSELITDTSNGPDAKAARAAMLLRCHAAALQRLSCSALLQLCHKIQTLSASRTRLCKVATGCSQGETWTPRSSGRVCRHLIQPSSKGSRRRRASQRTLRLGFAAKMDKVKAAGRAIKNSPRVVKKKFAEVKGKHSEELLQMQNCLLLHGRVILVSRMRTS